MAAFLRWVFAALCVSLLVQAASAASTDRVSVSSLERQANGDSRNPSVSADARFVAFASDAKNLVPGDTNDKSDVFVRDLLTAETERISVDSDEIQANDASDEPSLSSDGRFVAFASKSTNLVPEDTNGKSDVFVRDRLTGLTEIVSVDAEGQLASDSGDPSISGDGHRVAFTLFVVDEFAEFRWTILVRDRQTSTTTEHTIGGLSPINSSPSISADGHFLAWSCNERDPGGASDEWGICIQDLQSSTAAHRLIGPNDPKVGYGSEVGHREDKFDPSISFDGRYVSYTKTDHSLYPENGFNDIYVDDSMTRIREVMSINIYGDPSDGASYASSISSDGRFVGFVSDATDLVPDDTNGVSDVFVRDRKTRTTRRVSVNSAGNQGNKSSAAPSITPNGSFVVFSSDASNLVAGDSNRVGDVFLRVRGPQPDGRDDLLVDFGAHGLWQWLNNKNWLKIESASPLGIATSDLDGNFRSEAISGFVGRGLLARYNNNQAWQKIYQLASNRIVGGDFDGNGTGDLAADFGTRGVWIRVNNAAWVKVNTSTESLKVGDLDGNGKDELIARLSSGGLWARYNNSGWKLIRNASPQRITTGDLDGNGKDEVIADLGSNGLWVFFNNNSWKRLTASISQGLATGDLDGNGKEDLLVDLGRNGLWAYYNNTAPPVKLDNRSPSNILITDLDRNGKGDIAADFGAAGIWVRYNNTGAFRQIKPWPSQAIIAGGFD